MCAYVNIATVAYICSTQINHSKICDQHCVNWNTIMVPSDNVNCPLLTDNEVLTVSTLYELVLKQHQSGTNACTYGSITAPGQIP